MRTPLRVISIIAAAATALTACSIADSPPKNSPTPTSEPSQTASLTYPTTSEKPNVRLTVTILTGNARSQSTYHLFCVGRSAVNGTDITEGDAACTVIDRRPNLLSRKLTDSSEKCDPVGQPNVADVYGELNGKEVRTSFRRDNSCNVSTWDALEALLGTVEK